MTDETTEPEEGDGESAKKGGGKLPLILGLVAALATGGGGFFVVFSGIIDPLALAGLKQETADTHASAEHSAPAEPMIEVAHSSVAFVPMDPIMISLPPDASAKHLRFTGQLEVHPGQEESVTAVMPRILDVLNTYLRAVDVRDIEQPSSAAKLRAQMLRRIQVVTGEGMVRDLLVTEFVLN